MIDFDALVIGPLQRVFGEDLKPVYRPAAGGSFEIDGIFDNAYRALVMAADQDPAIATVDPVLGVRLSQFPAPPVQGDRVTIPRVGKTYVVADIQSDSHGAARLLLNLAV